MRTRYSQLCLLTTTELGTFEYFIRRLRMESLTSAKPSRYHHLFRPGNDFLVVASTTGAHWFSVVNNGKVPGSWKRKEGELVPRGR